MYQTPLTTRPSTPGNALKSSVFSVQLARTDTANQISGPHSGGKGGHLVTSVANGEARKLARGAVEVSAAVDERRDEAGRGDGVVECGAVAAEVAQHVAGSRAHLPIPVPQQWPHLLHYPGLPRRLAATRSQAAELTSIKLILKPTKCPYLGLPTFSSMQVFSPAQLFCSSTLSLLGCASMQPSICLTRCRPF